MLRRLYLTVTCIPPSPISKVEFTTKLDNLTFCRDVQEVQFPKWQDQPHITKTSLPEKASDIRGVDSCLYAHLRKKQLLRRLPTLALNKFFTLRFADTLHHISIVRKSNIAYTFRNKFAPVLNDLGLEKEFKTYNGRYRNLVFFLSLPTATATAVARTRFRKCLRRILLQVLHEAIPDQDPAKIERVSGIFLFSFLTVIVTPEDVQVVEKLLRTAVATLLKDRKFRNSLAKVTMEQNKEFKNGSALMQEANLENSLGARELPGWYPKLPFIDSMSK